MPNSDSRTNTATAIGRIPSTANTKSFSGTAAVNFAGVTPSVTGYASVTVNDAYNGGAPTTLGTVALTYNVVTAGQPACLSSCPMSCASGLAPVP